MESVPLPYMAVGRKKDVTIIASLCATGDSDDEAKHKDTFKKLLNVAEKKIKPGQRMRLQTQNAGCVCIMMDTKGQFLYFVVTSSADYEERTAYQLLQELMQVLQDNGNGELAEAGGLSEELRPRMQKLLDLYSKLGGSSELQSAVDKVNVVKSTMEESLRAVSATGRSAEDLESKTFSMSTQSAIFSDRTAELRNQYWYNNQKMMLALALLVVLLFVIIIMTLR